MAIDKKYKLPFKIIGSSSVTGGYTDVLHTTLGPGTEITNWHRDAYGNLDEAVLQSPFTEQWVGGRSHRHVNLNTGSDSAQNRPEAWHLEFTKQKEEIIFNLTEDFNSFSNGEKLSSETYFEGDGTSEVRTRTIDVVGKKYFVFTGAVPRFLKIKNTGPINSLTYTYLVNVQDGITYDFVNGLALEDPDPGEDLELEYSYDNVNWTRKKVIFNGSDYSNPSLREITETVDFSAELPTYVRFSQTSVYDENFGSEVDNYALTDISISAGTPGQGAKASFYSHAYRSSPPAYWSRDGLAKRPVNITNIVNTDLYVGNYSRGYEYLQTTGRRLTNNLIVDGFIASGSLTTQFIGGRNFSIEENFSDYSQNAILLGNGNDGHPFLEGTRCIVKTQTETGRKFIIFSLGPGEVSPRIVKYKTKIKGKLFISYTAIVNRNSSLSTDGLSLDKAEDTEDLKLQYSYDEIVWTDFHTVLTGTNVVTATTEEVSETITFSPPSDEAYYIRFCAPTDYDGYGSNSTQGANADEYGITNLKIVHSDSFNYLLPDLTQTSKTVIVERFNAPGSKEESSRGALDREGEEMSPNIPLPYRNIKIRQPYYRQLAQHMPQFGSGSTYKLLPDVGTTDAVTVHKINRNRLVRGGVEYFDNWFVQHAIPRTDIQYSWITASATTTAAELGGYQSSKDKYAYNDINFVTASLIVGGLEVDNLYIDSYVKNSKTVDITTNTFSIEASLSASFSEYTNSPYSFGTFASTRLGDSPVARSLRVNNIISVLNPSKQKQYQSLTGMLITIPPERGDSSTNFVEPPVTFKYRPLEHRVSTNDDVNQAASWFYPYTNFFSSYANKTLLEDRLDTTDGAVTFYDILKSDFEDGQLFYHGHSYREIIWPKEENTGLKETRQRAEYILDQAGFDRDGYDRPLGTQRVFWRDAQADRQRSLNSEGGYTNSLGYLSTEETGSNFTQNETGILTINNKLVSLSSSFVQNSDIDNGLYNSISFLESYSLERELFDYSSNVVKGNYSASGSFIDSIESSNYKRGYIYDLSGEFNNLYNDFYEQILEGANKKSLGSLYRSTGYKSLVLSRLENQDDILLLEDDEIFSNPKLKYISFVGGVELNTGSFVQNANNFSPNYQYAYPIISSSPQTIDFVGSDLYIGGEFLSINNADIARLAKWDGSSWSEVGDIASGTVIDILSYGTDLYVGGSLTAVNDGATVIGNIAKWNTSTLTWDTLDGGLDDDVNTLLLSGSDIYAAGSFSNDALNSITLNNIAKWNGSTWSQPAGGVSGSVYDSVLVNGDIYFVGPISTIDPDGSNTATFGGTVVFDGTTIEQVGQPQGWFPISIEKDDIGDIYVSMIGDPEGKASWIHKWDYTSWSSPGNYIIDFDSYNVGDLINDSTWTSGLGNTVRAGSATSAYPGKKFHVFNSYATSSRIFQLDQQLTGTVAVSYLALVNNSTSTYDSGFLNLENAEAGEDLILQYSTNGVDWSNYETLLTGSAAANGLGLIDKRDTIIVEGITEPYYLRFSQTAGSPSSDNYALADITIGNNYLAKQTGAPRAAVYSLKNYQNELYIAGTFTFRGAELPLNNILKLSGSNYYDVDPNKKMNAFVRGMSISGSDLYAVGYMEKDSISKIALYDYENNDWTNIYNNSEIYLFASDYFDQTFSDSDFSFSTMDNGLVRTTEADSGKKPFFDSYEDFITDVRGAAKDYSVIPEFRISEHMEYYVKEKGGNFRAENNSILSLDGVGSDYRSSLIQTGSLSDTFFASYLTSDLLKKEEDVREDEDCELENISVTVSGIKKLLPYNGFYPQDRTVQLANLYGDYVDNKLHGGIYNINYNKDFVYKKLVSTNDNSNAAISTIKYQENYYIASKDGNQVQIYQIIGEDPTSTNIELKTEFNYDFNINGDIKILSASNGLNILFSSLATGSADASFSGILFHSTSSNGEDWSTPSFLQILDSAPAEYISGSDGNQMLYFDAIVDSVDNQEKIIIVTAGDQSFNLGSITKYGEVYSVTGTLENNQWNWSEKNIIYTGTSTTQGTKSPTIISCSSGYQMAFGAGNQSATSSSGSIFIAESSNGYDWSTPVIIASGLDPSTDYAVIAAGGIKMIDFENKTHIFFAHNGAFNGYSDNGAVFTVTSSLNNTWPTTNSDLNKKVLYYRNIDNDQALSTGYYHPAISVFSGSDSRLYYSFANYGANFCSNEIAMGFYRNGYYLDSDSDNLLRITEPSNTNRYFSIIDASPYELNGFVLPVFFTNRSSLEEGYEIRVIKNNIFSEFSLKVSGSEKYYKHAALEPFFAPGILYNTIKSGIAVDWPCATGSQTSIQPYGSNSIVNAYYPQSFQMASYSGSVIQESAYGQLRSNIDYRIPFERLIFPDDAFEAKPERTTDLVEVTPIEALDADSEIVKFIDKNYIYGGYEPYISPVDFSDIDKTGPKRFSVPFVYRKESATDSGLYSLAMSNFLAETVRFFLQDEKMVTFTSKPDIDWPEFSQYTTYYMDVVLTKSPELVTMEAWHSDLHPTGSNGEKMNGRYFGYPVNKTDKALWGSEDFTEEESRLIHNDPAYAPYTPPYFEGEVIVRIAFKPSLTKTYTLKEILENATIENIFKGVSKGATAGSDAYRNAMPVQSSVNIFGSANPVNVEINEATGERTVVNQIGTEQWIISPYMETPVLDFSDQTLTPYQNDYSKTSGHGRGMWSGYGKIPTQGNNINISLRESHPSEVGVVAGYSFSSNETYTPTGSLLQQVGFTTESKPIGQIAGTKKISEAVVLIPYVETDIENKTTEILDNYHFITIDTDIFEKIKNREIIEATSISGMINTMKKYVIPPQLNFLQHEDIKPFVMYIVEFEHVLDQQDLTDIWQGLMPEISYTAEMDNVSINHPTGENEFFHGEPLPTNLRWMVFKVKKKAEADYFKVTADTSDDERFNFNKIIGREQGTDIYSYNWPYDFFSLVEFAKVELKLDYKKKET